MLWSVDDLWRAPIGDFPPSWAIAWGDDAFGLWADIAVNGVIQRMRWIEPSGPDGFCMGSAKKEREGIKDKHVRDWANKTEHDPSLVVLKEGFWLANTPCTQRFWQAVTGGNPSNFDKGHEAPERPVENVSWDDVMNLFVARFTLMLGLSARGRLCLPTELQWEYAARAGTRTAYWWGDEWDATRGNADVSGARGLGDKEGSTPVLRHEPSPWGLYDVHGNVWEWCSDSWLPPRAMSKARPDFDERAVRGGSWVDHPSDARAASCDGWHRWNASRYLGFRFVIKYLKKPKDD